MIYFVADGYSDCGRVRDHNEDIFRIDSWRGMFVVADGIGGHACGEIASALAVETVFNTLFAENSRNAEKLEAAIMLANNTIYQDAQMNPERKGMGTTLTLMCWDRCQFYFGHIGDSRAYRLRGNNLLQITRDHTWVDSQVSSGLLSQHEAAQTQMCHVLLKSLGTQPWVEPDIIPVDARPKDRFLICSDGLSDLVEHNNLQKILAGHGTLPMITKRLVEAANAVGGRDNITAVVIDCYDNKWKAIMKSVINRIRR